MANYKRRKCRYNGRYKVSSEALMRKRLGIKPIMPGPPPCPYRDGATAYNQWHNAYWSIGRNRQYKNCPRAWDILYHIRPHRRSEKSLEKKVLKGNIDVDDIAWPVKGKPKEYFF